jgi:hypothetical protein
MGLEVPDRGVKVSTPAKEGVHGGTMDSPMRNGWVSKYQIQA